MALSRRQFTAAAGTAVALTVLGCDKSPSPGPVPAAAPAGGGPPGSPGGPGGGRAGGQAGGRPAGNRIELAKEPFVAGPLDKYKAAGVYGDFRGTKGVFLVSDGKALYAVNATCTHKSCTVEWKAADSRFDCPCHHSHFDSQGNIVGNGKAKLPLEHLAIQLITPDTGDKTPVVQVDPTKRFLGDKNQWADPAAMLKLS